MKVAAFRAASRYTNDCSGLIDLKAAEARAKAAIARPFQEVTIYYKRGDATMNLIVKMRAWSIFEAVS